MSCSILLGNRLFPLSRDQFVAVSTAFRQAAERLFDTPCTFRAKGAVQDSMGLENYVNPVFNVDKPEDVTMEQWETSLFAYAYIWPADQSLDNADFPHAEGAGRRIPEADKDKPPATSYASLDLRHTCPHQAFGAIWPDSDHIKADSPTEREQRIYETLQGIARQFPAMKHDFDGHPRADKRTGLLGQRLQDIGRELTGRKVYSPLCRPAVQVRLAKLYRPRKTR